MLDRQGDMTLYFVDLEKTFDVAPRKTIVARWRITREIQNLVEAMQAGFRYSNIKKLR